MGLKGDSGNFMHSIIYITTSGLEESRRIARVLLKEKLVACTNIVPAVESMYLWKGEIEEASESLLIAKTMSCNVKKVIKMVEDIHSYDIPCILQIKVENGSEDYLEWMESEIS